MFATKFASPQVFARSGNFCKGTPLKSPSPARGVSVVSRTLKRSALKTRAQVGLFYTTTTGHTEEVADALKEIMGEAVTDPMDLSDKEVGDLLEYDGLIVGSPTWNTGADEGRSGTAWDEMLEEVRGMDFAGKKVAVFGCGDQISYSDYFCDAVEEVHSSFATAGADMVGQFSTKGYDFEESKSVVGGEPLGSSDADAMLGLCIDEENQSDMTEERVKQWAGQLKKEMGL